MFTMCVAKVVRTALPLVFLAAAGCGSDPIEPTGTTGSGGGTGTGGAGTGGGGAGGGSGGGAPAEYAALVRGTLADASDLAKAKATHDQIATMGEAQSKAAGDFAHDVLLGTTLLDSTKDEFFAMDRWTDATAMQAFYADPMVQQAFGSLFAAPPTIEFFVAAPTWVSWGNMTSGDTFDPYFFHLALGLLKDTDTAKNKAAHDQVASGGKQPSLDAGNVAHVVFLGLTDERRFVAVDVWSKSDNIQAFYTNPQFVAAFGPLFESATQPVYQSTTWHQW